MAPNNAARRPDDGSDEFARSSSLGRAPEDKVVGGARADLHNRLNGVMERQAANNTSFAREAAAEAAPAADPHAAAAGHAEDDHGHAKPAGKKKVSFLDKIEWADLKGLYRSVNRARKLYKKGELDGESLAEVLDDAFGAIKSEVTDGMRQVMMPELIAWMATKIFKLSEHPIHPITPAYTAIAAQILDFHQDDDGTYHHSVEGLSAGMNELELKKNYGCFSTRAKFDSSKETLEGKQLLKTQMGRLLQEGDDTYEEVQITTREILEHFGATFTTSDANSPIAHPPHDFNSKHANHCMHAFIRYVMNLREFVTKDNIGSILKPEENVKLEEKIEKFGVNVMTKVRGDSGMAKKLLGAVVLDDFNQSFRLLLDDKTLEEAILREPGEVKVQLFQLTNLADPEGKGNPHISAKELRDRLEVMIGKPPYVATAAVPATPTTPAIPAVPASNDGGYLGKRDQLPAESHANFDALRLRISEIGNRLIPRLEQLFPDQVTEMKPNEFGAQLVKEMRHKNGYARFHSRTAYLRGVDRQAFEEHFGTLLDPAALKRAISGSTEAKEAVKARLRQFTGIPEAQLTETMFIGKGTELVNALSDATAPDVLDPVEHAALIRNRDDATLGIVPVINRVIANVRTALPGDKLAKFFETSETHNFDGALETLGTTLLQKVKGNSGKAEALLKIITPATFDHAYRVLLNQTQLDGTIYDNPQEVANQVHKLLGVKPPLDATELDAVVEALTGIPSGASYAAGSTGTDGKALGKWDDLSSEAQAMFNHLRKGYIEVRDLLQKPSAGPGSPTYLQLLSPDAKQEVKYSEFGNQLLRLDQEKTGTALERARIAYMRGWNQTAFENHFINLTNKDLLQSSANGTSTERGALKQSIRELTGLNLARIPLPILKARLADLKKAAGVTSSPLPAPWDAKQKEIEISLDKIETELGKHLNAIYLEVNLEEQLGKALQEAPITDPDYVTAIFDKISALLLANSYGLVLWDETQFSAQSVSKQQAFKQQLAGILGVSKNFVWDQSTVASLVAELEKRINLANTTAIGGSHPNALELKKWIDHIKAFNQTLFDKLNKI